MHKTSSEQNVFHMNKKLTSFSISICNKLKRIDFKTKYDAHKKSAELIIRKLSLKNNHASAPKRSEIVILSSAATRNLFFVGIKRFLYAFEMTE